LITIDPILDFFYNKCTYFGIYRNYYDIKYLDNHKISIDNAYMYLYAGIC